MNTENTQQQTTPPATTQPASTQPASTPPSAAPAMSIAPDPWHGVPEKFRVTKDGKPDMTSTMKKLADSYTSLEKKFSEPRKAPKEGYDRSKIPERLQVSDDLLADLRKQDLTQEQFDFVISKFAGEAISAIEEQQQAVEQLRQSIERRQLKMDLGIDSDDKLNELLESAKTYAQKEYGEYQAYLLTRDAQGVKGLLKAMQDKIGSTSIPDNKGSAKPTRAQAFARMQELKASGKYWTPEGQAEVAKMYQDAAA